MKIFHKTLFGLICLFSTAYADDINLFRIGIGGLYGSYTSDAGGMISKI
uniref:Uncharacterized protein n=1 Tax=uncultured Helicobacter sp. TaxID=175537 RepID=A0A650F334_9HELI|nr:hypothetical protein Helico6505_0670 [uncultured Helicobacter sp.]